MAQDQINTKLLSLRRLLRRLILIAGVSRILLIAIGLLALCLLVDWTFELSGGWRVAVGLASLAALAAAVARFLVQPLLVPMPDDQLALLYERRFPELSDLLVSAVQLARDPGPASPQMVSAVITRAESAADAVEPRNVPRTRTLRRIVLGAIAATLAAAVLCGLFPGSARIFAARYLHPFGPAEWPKSTELVIEVAGLKDAEIAVPRGDQVAVKVTALNARHSPLWVPPRAVWLDFEFKSGERDSRPMRLTEGQAYEAYFNDVADDLVLRARAGNSRTAQVRVRVVDLPRAEDTWLSLEYPKYTGLPPEGPIRSATEIGALAGTKVAVRIKANRPIQPGGAAIRIDPTGTVPMRPASGSDGATHAGQFTLEPGMRWFRIELTDTSGLKSKQPRTFQLQVAEDKPPAVRITRPGGQLRCTPYAVVPLDISVKDDLAIRSAWLRYALGPREKAQTVPLDPVDKTAKEARLTHRWDLSELGVKVGDAITYAAEADDFRDVFPPGSGLTRQVGKSDEYYIKIVSAADLASELDARLFALRDEVKKAKVRQEEDRRQAGELLRKIAEGRPLTNDDRSLATDAENIQRELSRTTARIAEEVGKVRELMQDNRIGSFADRRRLEETQTALLSLSDTDMPRAADFVKNARKDLASPDGRTSLQNAARLQDAIITRLDQVLAAMSHNEDIDNLVRAARELLRKETSIKADTGEFAKRPETFGTAPADLKPPDLAALNLLVRAQKSACDDMRNLEQDMLNVFERLKDRDPKRADLVRQAQTQAGSDQIRPRMEDAAATLAGNQIGLAGSHEDSAVKGLQRLLDTLEKAREESGSDETLAQALRDIRSALEDVQRLRRLQQGHASDAAEVNRNIAQAARLKELRRELNRIREEQDRTAAEAKNPAALDALAPREDKLAQDAATLGHNLDKEAADAATRRAPQAEPIREATKEVLSAEPEMKAAHAAMKAAQPPTPSSSDKSVRSGQAASNHLAQADQALGRALDAMEQKRLANTREAAIKQGETAKQSEETAARLNQLARENESQSKEAAEGLGKAGEHVEGATQNMKDSQSGLDKNDTATGEKEATEARDKLAQAEETLRKLRDDLENKQKEQKLLDLIVELQPMLEKQMEINGETLRIDTATAQQKLPEPSRPDQIRLTQLSADESQLAGKAGELLKKIEGEDAPVFAWGFTKLARDMNEVKAQLAAAHTDAYVQEVETDIADTLRMLIDALKREQSRMREESAGGGGGGGSGGKPMLVPPSAQLKLLKARQLEIHNGTKRADLKRLVERDKPLSPLEEKHVRRLAAEQTELGQLTAQLADALEREVNGDNEDEETPEDAPEETP